MNKNQTIGKKGEKIIKDLLIKNKIEYTDLTKNKIKQTVFVMIDDIEYKYDRLIYSHHFDLIVNDKNVEIKTSTLNKENKFNLTLTKNKKELIDYIVLVILKNNKPINYHCFNKEMFSKYKAIKLGNDIDSKINEKELINIFKTNS